MNVSTSNFTNIPNSGEKYATSNLENDLAFGESDRPSLATHRSRSLHCIAPPTKNPRGDIVVISRKGRSSPFDVKRRAKKILLRSLSLTPETYVRLSMQCAFPDVSIPCEMPTMSMGRSFFRAATAHDLESYDKDAIRAVQNRNLKALRIMYYEEGRSLQACNSFGESLIHMACRRGFVDVVSFLTKEAGVTIRVRDDYGRTPLHDACWTAKPCYELLDMLIDMDPMLLLLSDARGNTPFEYVRKEHWVGWLRFLSKKFSCGVNLSRQSLLNVIELNSMSRGRAESVYSSEMPKDRHEIPQRRHSDIVFIYREGKKRK